MNFRGSSKSMEVSAILKVVEDALYNCLFIIDVIVSDNGSTMRAVLKHPSKGDRVQVINSSKVNLHEDIPEPSVLADPSHRVKVVANAYSPLSRKLGICDAGAPKQMTSGSKNIGGP